MAIEIRLLNEEQWKEYDAYVHRHPQAMLYHSLPYLRMLTHVVAGKLVILGAYIRERIVAVLPFFISSDHGMGKVLNSLPFFGSHGGILADDMHRQSAFKGLLSELDSQALRNDCVTATIILTPFEKNEKLYLDLWRPQLQDNRIGQITILPSSPEEILSAVSEAKRRNNIKSAQRRGVTILSSADAQCIAWMKHMHEQGIGSKGGVIKPPAFFEWCKAKARVSDFCSFYFAKVDDRLAAGVILFNYKHYTEYYVPVVDLAYSEYNPLVLLIYTAMCDAVRTGRQMWNFGGTWQTQDGVYRFKRQFGANDLPYKYLIKVYDEAILNALRNDLLSNFPYFYVVPYSALKSCT